MTIDPSGPTDPGSGSAAPATRPPCDRYRLAWTLAWPVILSNVTTPLLGAVDTAVVGHLPDPAYIGAVAVGAMIFTYVFWGFGFLRMGTTGLTAQAFGAGDRGEIRACLGRAGLIALGLALLIWLMRDPAADVAFAILEGSEAVEGHARTYFEIRVWSAPAALGNYVLFGWFLGLQRPKTALGLQILLNGLNIVLDLLFVLAFGWGVAGVAVATVIAESIACVAGAVIALRLLAGDGHRWDLRVLMDKAKLAALIGLNANIFIRTFCILLAFSSFTAIGAQSGDVTLAANAVLMTLVSIMAHGLDGFAHAAETMVGHAIGRKSRTAFKAAIRATTVLSVALAVALSLSSVFAGSLAIGLLTGIDSVRAEADRYLPWVVLSPLVSVWSYQLDGIFIGATRTAAMRNTVIVSLAAYTAALVVLYPWFDNHGLWAAIIIFNSLRGITLGLCLSAVTRSIPEANHS